MIHPLESSPSFSDTEEQLGDAHDNESLSAENIEEARSRIESAIEALVRSIEAQKQDIADKKKQIDDLEKIRRNILRIQGTGRPSISIPDGFGARKRERKESLSWTVRRIAYQILKERGRPLNRSQLLAELRERGVEAPGTQPAKTIAKILWKAIEFEYRDRGYWLKGEPLRSLGSSDTNETREGL